MGIEVDQLYWTLTAKDAGLSDGMARAQVEMRRSAQVATETGRTFDRAIGGGARRAIAQMAQEGEKGTAALRSVAGGAADTGRAVEGAGRQVGIFEERVRGATTVLLGLLMILADRGMGLLKGFAGWIGRTTTGLVDLGAVGALNASQGLRRLAETTRDANGELSTLGKGAWLASEGLEVVGKVALTVSGVITGVQIAAASAAAALVVAGHRAQTEFAPGWNRVLTVLGESEDGFRSLRDEVSRTAASVGVDGRIASAALYEIYGAMPEVLERPERALGALREALEVNRTGFATAGEATSAMTGLLNAFNLEIEQSTEVLDSLWAAQDAGEFVFGEIAREIGPVSATISALGGSYKDLLAILATTTPIGIPTAEAVTQVESALGSLLARAEESQAAARELGLDVSAAAIRAKGLAGVLVEIIEATKGDPEALRRFFPDREGLQLMIQLSQRTEKLRARIEDVSQAGGRHRQIVEQMNASWEAQSEILDQQIKGGLRSIGSDFEGAGVKGMHFVNTMLAGMDEFARRVKGSQVEVNRLGRDFNRWITGRQNDRRPLLRPGPGDGTITPGLMSLPQSRPPSPFDSYLPGGSVGPGPRAGRPVGFRPRTPTNEPVSVEAATQKVKDYAAQLEAAAVVEYARTQNFAAYERAARSAEIAVRDLALAEADRLRRAGISEESVTEFVAEVAPPPKAEPVDADAERRTRQAAEQRKQDLKELEEARLRHATAVEREAMELRRLAALARQYGDQDLARELAIEARQLEIFGVLAQDAADKLKTVATAGEELTVVDPFGEVLRNVQPELEAAERQFETTMGRLREEMARELISEGEFQREARTAAESFNRSFLAVLEKLDLPEHLKTEIRAKLKLETEVDTRGLSDAMQEIIAVVRGITALADAFGVLDESSRKVLTGITDVAGGIESILSGKPITGAFQVIGGAVNTLSGIFRGNTEQSRQLVRANIDLKAAIKKLSDNILNDRTSTEVREDRGALARASGQLRGDPDTFEGGSIGDAADRRAALARTAVSMGLANASDSKAAQIEALQRWAEEMDAKYGTNLAHYVENSLSADFLKAVDALNAQLGVELGEMGQFGDDVAGIIARVNFEMDALGKTDAAERIRAVVAALRAAGRDLGEFGDELQALAGVDLSTEEGRAERDEIIAAVIARMQEGTASAPIDFGELTPAELHELLLEFQRAGTDGDDSGATQSFQVSRTITEVTGNRLFGVLTTIAYYVRKLVAHITGSDEVPIYEPPPARPAPVSPPTPVAPPPPAPPAPPPPAPPTPAPPPEGGGGVGGPTWRPGDPVAIESLTLETLQVGQLVSASLAVPDLDALLASLTERLAPLRAPEPLQPLQPPTWEQLNRAFPPAQASPVMQSPVSVTFEAGAFAPVIQTPPGADADEVERIVRRVVLTDLTGAITRNVNAALQQARRKDEAAKGLRRL